MNINRFATVVAFAGGLAIATGAIAQDVAKKPHVPLEKPSAMSRRLVRSHRWR